MENNYVIVTDSTANLPYEMIEKYGVEVLSLNYYVDDQEYKGYEKGKEMDLTRFYQMMREKKHIVTSLVSIKDGVDLFSSILNQGMDLMYIGFSSGLSGTYQSMNMVLDDFKADYPERKIYAIDSLSAALGEGLLVYYALMNKEAGMSIEENADWIIKNRKRICHWFTVDDLFFLKRGGRISATTAVVGTTLSIKPVLHVDNEGHLISMKNVRGRKKSLDELVEKLTEHIAEPLNQPIFISHGDALKDAEYVAKKIKERIDVEVTLISVLDPVIGAHSGPGTIALFFMGDER